MEARLVRKELQKCWRTEGCVEAWPQTTTSSHVLTAHPILEQREPLRDLPRAQRKISQPAQREQGPFHPRIHLRSLETTTDRDALCVLFTVGRLPEIGLLIAHKQLDYSSLSAIRLLYNNHNKPPKPETCLFDPLLMCF